MTSREVDPVHRRKARGRPRDPLSVAGRLRAGATVFTDNTSAEGYRTKLRRQGYRLHTRRATIDGVAGVVMWAVPEP